LRGPEFAAEELSLFARLVRVFYAPAQSFAAVLGRETAHDWLLPVLLTCLVGLAAHHLTLDIVANAEAPQIRRQLEQMDQERRQQYERSVEMLRAQGWAMIPVGLFTSLVVVGGLLMVLARWPFGAEVGFRQMLVVKGYATLVVAVEWLARTALILATGNPLVHTGLGAFVPQAMEQTFAGKVLIGVNFFDLWQIGVLGIGLGTMASVPAKRAFFALLALWLLWLMGGAAVEVATQGMAPAAPAS
jgi:hypothetical protein